jgi:hypothetical protein
MRFRIPGLFTDSGDAFPSTLRQLRRWLKELPLINKDETTRLYLGGLQSHNALPLPPRTRLENMEELRPSGQSILHDLDKQLASRTLPLPSKSRLTWQSALAIRRQLAAGYAGCLESDGGDEGPLSKDGFALAVHRAMSSLAEAFAVAARLYAPYPPGLWSEINRLYALAETQGVTDYLVEDKSDLDLPRSTIADVFKQSHLLAISAPQSLHRGDVQRLTDYLKQAARLCTLSATPVADASGGAFMVDLTADEPGFYMMLSEMHPTPEMRALNLTQLQRDLRDHMHRTPGARAVDGFARRESPDPDLARRLLAAWSSTNAQRRFSRAPKGTEVDLAVGLSHIWEALSPKPDPSANGLTYDVPVRARLSDDAPADASDVWGSVGYGNFVGEWPPRGQRQTQQPRTRRPEDWQTWRVRDTSAGGYSLVWSGTAPSTVQVGDLVAASDGPDLDNTRLGLIRWMQAEEAGELHIGIELLAQRAVPATVVRVANRALDKDLPARVLIVPAVKSSQIGPTLLTPPKLVAVGDELTLAVAAHESTAVVRRIVEHTGACSVYRLDPSSNQVGHGT